ncbi:MAG TPA: DUF2249 domain-containing protein [candidate division Zixibacteria bacterium]|nr:DUF2249 domain-containing protein [candidate division Zixibacteria bacterium]
MSNQTVTLDIRPVPVREKHPTIFRTFDALGPGETLLLINDHDPRPLYYQFAAERAGEFDWSYVEQGPETWKVEIQKKGDSRRGAEALGHGHVEHHHFEKATEVLKHEHRVIERVLAVVQKLADTSRPFAAGPWQNAVEFIRGFADRCHHLKEEQLLFPLLEKHGIPREGGPIGMMLIEHEEGRRYVRAMAEALALAETDPEGAKGALVQNARAYLRLLRDHILKEDEILFNMADGSLTAEEQKQLVREFEEHEEKEVGAGVHEKYLTLVQELERACA